MAKSLKALVEAKYIIQQIFTGMVGLLLELQIVCPHFHMHATTDTKNIEVEWERAAPLSVSNSQETRIKLLNYVVLIK